MVDSPAPPDVIVVVLDTVRADHTSLHGYARGTTPRLDALAAKANVFRRAHASAPWTLPSHASLFTGRVPTEHGAHKVAGTDGVGIRPLGATWPTLAEWFLESGYATAGFAANEAFLTKTYGLARGFDTWHVALEPGHRVVDRALAWLDAEERDSVFLFVNLMDAHRPYNVSRLGVDVPWTARRAPHKVAELERTVLAGEPLDPNLRQNVIDQYDLGIAHADAALGALLDGLAARQRLEGAVVVVTSDHGEHFGEHGLALHGRGVHEEALHIPLVLKQPSQQAGSEDPRRVSSADLPGILAESAEMLSGIGQRFPRRPGGQPTMAQNYFGNLADQKEPWAARFAEPWAAVYDEDEKALWRANELVAVYDIGTDPGEHTDLTDLDPSVGTRATQTWTQLRETLMATEAPDPTETPGLDDETRERLEALGYL